LVALPLFFLPRSFRTFELFEILVSFKYIVESDTSHCFAVFLGRDVVTSGALDIYWPPDGQPHLVPGSSVIGCMHIIFRNYYFTHPILFKGCISKCPHAFFTATCLSTTSDQAQAFPCVGRFTDACLFTPDTLQTHSILDSDVRKREGPVATNMHRREIIPCFYPNRIAFVDYWLVAWAQTASMASIISQKKKKKKKIFGTKLVLSPERGEARRSDNSNQLDEHELIRGAPR
jgi:hypothetical protein